MKRIAKAIWMNGHWHTGALGMPSARRPELPGERCGLDDFGRYQ
jgi:hypothetical protein